MKRVVIMGGNEAYNDWTSTGAEFNFYCDPDAAEEVIRKVLCAVSMFVQHACSRQENVQAGSCMLVPQSACAVLLITSVFFLTVTVCIQHIAVLSIIVYCRMLHPTAAAHLHALYVTQSFVFHTILPFFSTVCWQDHSADMGVHAAESLAAKPCKSFGAEGSSLNPCSRSCVGA